MRVINPTIFDEFNIYYASSIREYNPLSLLSKHRNIINNWKSPNENYMYFSSRNKNANDIEVEQLEYLILECRNCSQEERYKAIIILMYRLYKLNSNLSLIDKAKYELIPYLLGAK